MHRRDKKITIQPPDASLEAELLPKNYQKDWIFCRIYEKIKFVIMTKYSQDT